MGRKVRKLHSWGVTGQTPKPMICSLMRSPLAHVSGGGRECLLSAWLCDRCRDDSEVDAVSGCLDLMLQWETGGWEADVIFLVRSKASYFLDAQISCVTLLL